MGAACCACAEPSTSKDSDFKNQNPTTAYADIPSPTQNEEELIEITEMSEKDEKTVQDANLNEIYENFSSESDNPTQDSDSTFEKAEEVKTTQNEEIAKMQEWFEKKMTRNDKIILSVNPKFSKDEIDQARMDILTEVYQ